jgi:hypothetical protein
MSDTTSIHLQTARAALERCQDLLADETPAWAELHAALQNAQRAIAVAEYCSDTNVSAPPPEMEAESVPEPVVAEPVVHEPVQPEPTAPEPEPLPMPEPIAAAEPTEPEPEPLPAAGASLAERLSEQRLDSLKNSLSINNRVRFASLLTDGDVPALLRLCDALEASNSFEAAQVLILEIAGDVDWDDEENGGVEFLSLVRRLFATA